MYIITIWDLFMIDKKFENCLTVLIDPLIESAPDF